MPQRGLEHKLYWSETPDLESDALSQGRHSSTTRYHSIYQSTFKAQHFLQIMATNPQLTLLYVMVSNMDMISLALMTSATTGLESTVPSMSIEVRMSNATNLSIFESNREDN